MICDITRYNTKETQQNIMSFSDRSDLTGEEKEALEGYQDIGNPQHKWDCDIPSSEPHRDCYVINSALRFVEFRDSLTNHDYEIVRKLIFNLDNAVSKSFTDKSYSLAKGLDNAEWILKRSIGESYTDEGFGSYSATKEQALRYAKIQKGGFRVFIYREIEAGKHAIYMGNKEEELLLPRGRRYEVIDIRTYSKGEIFDDSEAIIYYVRET